MHIRGHKGIRLDLVELVLAIAEILDGNDGRDSADNALTLGLVEDFSHLACFREACDVG